MTELSTSDITQALPELWFAIVGMALLMVGVFMGNQATRIVIWLTVLAFVVAGIMVLSGPETGTAFGGLIINDAFAVFMKVLVLIGGALTLIMSQGYLRREAMERFEYPILIIFATLGMFVMISANDFMTLYIGLEMQSLALYVCAAFQRGQSALQRGRSEIFRIGRGRLGHAALRLFDDLRFLGHDIVRRTVGSARRHAGEAMFRSVLSSALSSSPRASPSKSRRFRSICGRLMSTRARQHR